MRSPTKSPKLEPTRLARFSLVGAAGFAMDASVLTLLVNGGGWDHYAARGVSFALAVTATWYCNRHWVFGGSIRRGIEYAKYLVTQGFGALLNLGTYVLVIEGVPPLATLPVIPLAAGAFVALAFNYTAASLFVFRRVARSVAREISR